jgi:hypothetical protein
MSDLQRMAANRTGATSTRKPAPKNTIKMAKQPGDSDTLDTVGMAASVLGKGKVSARPQPSPGVEGVTPGAVERRLGGSTPTRQGGGSSAPPTQQAQFGPPQRKAIKPNQSGPGRSELAAPVGNIENFLRNLQTKKTRD